MIEELKALIKENNFLEFKDKFKKTLLNKHQKELLFEIAYRQQSLEFFKYIQKTINLSQEKKVNILIRTLIDETKIKDFDYISTIDDMILAKNLGDYASLLVKTQDDNFLIKFMQNKPIATFMNFKKIIYNSFKYKKVDFINYISNQNLDKNTIFYFGLYAFSFKYKEPFLNLLLNSIKYNPNIIEEVKSIKDKHLFLIKKEIESFINEAAIKALALNLNEVLHKKNIKSNEIKLKI